MRNVTKLLGTGLIGLAVVGLVVPAASANERTGPALDSAHVQSFPGESFSQYYGGRRYYGGRGYRYGRRGYGGGAVAAGVIGGLAVGALAGAAIAGSQPAPAYGYGGPGQPVGNVYGHDPRWVNYCASRYHSFDPASGTYLASDGNRYVCQ